MSGQNTIVSRSSAFYLTAATLLSALLLGGGTRAGFIGDVILQYFSVALLLVAAASVMRSSDKLSRRALLFCLAVSLIPLLQLVPLPPSVRGHLPGAHWISGAYELMDKPMTFWPVSLVPYATWLAFVSLIPPFAVFLGTLLLSDRERRKLSTVILGFCGLSVFVGLMQLAQGPDSALRFFKFTNPDDAVGFFANRNHFSSLLYCGTILTAAWIVNDIGQRPDFLSKKALSSRATLSVFAAFTLLAILVMAQAMARSRAGLMLSMVALFTVFPMALTYKSEDGAAPRSAKMIYTVTSLALLLSLQYALYRILARFEADPLQDARITFARNTYGAAKSYLPFGSGAGTFVWVYPAFEKPNELFHVFANRAHNDIVEGALEGGFPALILMAVFVFWFLRRVVDIWGPAYAGHHEADRTLMKAATVIVALIVLHSLVDYPLRTSAMACVAAFCCALLIPASRHRHSHSHGRREHRDNIGDAAAGQERRRAPVEPRVRPSSPAAEAGWSAPPGSGAKRFTAPGSEVPQPRSASRPAERWEGPAEWPAEWQGKDRVEGAEKKVPNSDGSTGGSGDNSKS